MTKLIERGFYKKTALATVVILHLTIVVGLMSVVAIS